jgi:hypothetical protein
MKRRQLIIINLIFIGLMLFSAGVVYQYMTGNKPLNIIHDLTNHNKTTVVTTSNCSTAPGIEGLATSQNPYLEKLAVYQDACHSYVTSTMMIFVGMPVSQQTATQSADQVATTLKQFAQYHVRPLVIAEPTDYSTGNNIDYGQFAAGDFNQWLNLYFSTLKQQGITDQEMGIWNPFPEANLPYWANNQPQYFAPDVNDYVSIMRQYFPTAQTSIMLSSATYQTTDFNWQDGEYDSLLPYVKGITPGSIDYAGLEGFPWVPPAGGSGPILNAAEFLNPSIISETAQYLGTKNIWFNTGTFSVKYALDPTQIASVSPQERKEILNTIDEQALILQKQGFSVSINMFAQDKSKDSEQTDWSYWNNDQPFNSLDTPVLTNFINQLNQQKVGFWLFDEE